MSLEKLTEDEKKFLEGQRKLMKGVMDLSFYICLGFFTQSIIIIICGIFKGQLVEEIEAKTWAVMEFVGFGLICVSWVVIKQNARKFLAIIDKFSEK